MKKLVLFLAMSSVLISCNKTDDTNIEETKERNSLAKIFGSSLVDSDAHVTITRTRAITPYDDRIDASSLAILADFDSNNVGTVYINDIALNPDPETGYGRVNIRGKERKDIDNLFGKTVTIKNPYCKVSEYCGIDFKFDMTHRLAPKIKGLKDMKYFHKNSDLVFSWNAEGNPNDLMILLVKATDQYKPNDKTTPLQFFKRFYNKDGSIVLSGSELESEGFKSGEIEFYFLRGNQYACTLPSKKVFDASSIDFVHFVDYYFVE